MEEVEASRGGWPTVTGEGTVGGADRAGAGDRGDRAVGARRFGARGCCSRSAISMPPSRSALIARGRLSSAASAGPAVPGEASGTGAGHRRDLGARGGRARRGWSWRTPRVATIARRPAGGPDHPDEQVRFVGPACRLRRHRDIPRSGLGRCSASPSATSTSASMKRSGRHIPGREARRVAASALRGSTAQRPSSVARRLRSAPPGSPGEHRRLRAPVHPRSGSRAPSRPSSYSQRGSPQSDHGYATRHRFENRQ